MVVVRTWDYGGAAGRDLYGQQVGLDGDVLGGAFIILATTYNQDQSAVTGDSSGLLVRPEPGSGCPA